MTDQQLFLFSLAYPAVPSALLSSLRIPWVKAIQELIKQQSAVDSADLQLAELVNPHPAVAYPDEPLRSVVYRMAETGFTRFPVVERDNPCKLVGIVSLTDLLKARIRNLGEERQRERVLHLRLLFPPRNRDA